MLLGRQRRWEGSTRKAPGKRPDCRKGLGRRRREAFEARYCPQNAATACGKSAAGQLKPGYCPQNATKAFGKGAAEAFEARLLPPGCSNSFRKPLEKRPECHKSLWQGRCGGI